MDLTELQRDFLNEIFNIGVGRGADVLNTMLSSHIVLKVPEIIVYDERESINFSEKNSSLASVALKFSGVLSGVCKLVFPSDSALKLIRNISEQSIGLNDTNFDAMSEGVLKEIGNIVLNSVMGVIGNTLNIKLEYSVPSIEEQPFDVALGMNENKKNVAILARISFLIQEMAVQGEVITIFNMDTFGNFLELMDSYINA